MSDSYGLSHHPPSISKQPPTWTNVPLHPLQSFPQKEFLIGLSMFLLTKRSILGWIVDGNPIFKKWIKVQNLSMNSIYDFIK